ncbi:MULTISPECIES: peptidase inhibitor family I36 protein [unclassified Streptomyces]|uniref:peptidase inhibitor family I36 protein n=1 Tax=unclassified Streptomyces TaxID=2593676 RepID=UPI0035D654ED
MERVHIMWGSKVSRRAVVTIAAALSITAMGAGTAQAGNGTCNTGVLSGEFCLFYNSGYKGGTYDSNVNKSAYNSPDVFYGTTHPLNNNSASVRNYNSSYYAHGYQFYNYDGWNYTVPPYGTTDSWGGALWEVYELPSTVKNGISSHKI